MRLSRRTRLAALAAAAGLASAPATASAIVGGTDAPAGKYPAVANVTISKAFGCTGTLVAPDWVLTAGHCSSLTGSAIATPASFPPSSFDVVVNTVARSGEGGERLSVDRVVVPGEYLGTSGFDTSLLHLSTPAKTAPVPVAGVGYEALWRPNVLTEVAGFGATREDGRPPATLQEVRIPITTDSACAAKYDSYETGTQLCAGYAEGGRDSCQGDSGGPMFSRTANGALFVVGATSYGEGCARPNVPGVYARLSDRVLREFVRGTAPAAVVDAKSGEVTTPAQTYDPVTKTVSSGKPEATTTPAAGSAGQPSPAGGPPPPAAGPGAPAGPGGTSTSRPSRASTPTRFRATLAVDRTLRRTVRTRGLRFRLKCSGACSAAVRFRVDAATARKLGLKARTIATTTVARDAPGRTTKALKASRALTRRVLAARGATFSVVATVKASAGGGASVLTVRAVLAGR